MIILIMALFAAVAFFGNMMIKSSPLRYLVTVLMFAGLIASVVAIVANMHDHYGMETETTTQKTQIFSAGSEQQSFGVLLYQTVGTSGKENAYIYKQVNTDKKVTISKPDLNTTSERENISGNKAYRVVETTRYVYKSDWYRLFFGIADNNRELKSKHVIYQVPDTWVAMTTKQAKSLPSKLAPKNDDEKAVVAAQQQQLAALAKTDPDKAATLQVQQVKKILNIQ